jgi:hypothetical protein
MCKIKYFFRDIKYCYQRIRYGWCDRDTWSIDHWFLEVMPPMLQHLRDNKYGHPWDMSEELWNKTLETMIFLFTEANEDRCSLKNNYGIDVEYEKWRDRQSYINKYREECKNKAFNVFKIRFWNLWD